MQEPRQTNGDSLLTTTEAAKRARMDRGKIHRSIKNGKLRASRVGWVYLINEGDLLDFIDKEREQQQAA